MASHLLKLLHSQTPTPFFKTLSLPSSCRLTVSSSSASTPPSSREEAISQAKLSLCTTLKKPLNNPIPLPTRKLKKLSQPRYRVEIPVIDDSADSLTLLASEVFSNLPITRKGSRPTILILWPNPTMLGLACQAFDSADLVANSDLDSVPADILTAADITVFSAPEVSQLEEIKRVTSILYPKPVVLFNPKWSFEDEKDIGGSIGSFVGSFDVVYSFMGLEVRGVISRRKGVVFKFAKDGIVSGEGWMVMVEEEEGKKKGELRVVSRFKRRPSIGEVESVLYNLMAANSPVTKSVKFMRDWASGVMGQKEKE